jgi:ATP-dependent Clp protease protease subunit
LTSRELLFEHGISIKNRTIFLSGDIENGKCEAVIRGLILLASLGPQDITLVVNSFGGDLYDTFGIYDTMRSIPNQIRTVAMGKCQSAAPLLVAGGTPNKRFSLPSCQFMVHDIWIGEAPDATVEAATKELRHTKQLRKLYLDLMAVNTKKTAEEWKKICRRPGDLFFGPQEALKYGIIDAVATTIAWSGQDGESK